MELQPYGNSECIVYEPYTGVSYKTTIDSINKIQYELNNKLESGRYFSIKELYEILTEKWPEDMKAKFWQRFYDCIGWVTDGYNLNYYKWRQIKDLDENGNLVITFELGPD